MSFFRAVSRTAAKVQDARIVKGGRKEILEMKERLVGTPQFSQFFYALINDVNHPPRHIEATQTGDVWSASWEPSVGNYEPYTTHKFSDSNIGYIEGCAMYLLIQDCYPNVYDFPGNTIADIQNGATIKLLMKKNFIGKAINPASVPRPVAPAPQAPAAPVAQAPAAAPAFCMHCGAKLTPGAAFCASCGNKIG